MCEGGNPWEWVVEATGSGYNERLFSILSIRLATLYPSFIADKPIPCAARQRALAGRNRT